MYYDPMSIDLMVCVCEGYLGGTIVFVRDIMRGERVGWGEGRAEEIYIDFSCFERYGRAAGREREKGRDEGSKG